MSTKEIMIEVAQKLPADATLADAIYELEFRQAVEQGFASLDRGEGVPLAEARKRIRQWTTKSFPSCPLAQVILRDGPAPAQRAE